MEATFLIQFLFAFLYEVYVCELTEPECIIINRFRFNAYFVLKPVEISFRQTVFLYLKRTKMYAYWHENETVVMGTVCVPRCKIHIQALSSWD